MAAAAPTAVELAEFFLDSARYGDLDDINAALAEGVPVDAADSSGRTVQLTAAELAGAHNDLKQPTSFAVPQNVHAKNQEGNTPLHWACLNGHTEVVRALLEQQASASALNNNSRTPVDEALGRDHQEVMEVINSFHGGSVQDVTGDDIEEEEEEEEEAGQGQALDAVEVQEAAAGEPVSRPAPANGSL